MERLCVRFGGSAWPTKEEERVFWSYEDLGTFFVLVALLSLILHALVRLGVLPETELSELDGSLQLPVASVLIASLFAVLKMRRRKPVLRSLGWVLPRSGQMFLALLTGVLLAVGVLLYTGAASHRGPQVPSMEAIITVSLLGPILEETLFRGCLLPLIAKSMGDALAIAASSGLFAVLHAPRDIAHAAFLLITGIVYGCIRVASRTTTLPTLAHGACNLILLVTAS
jgi:membrane protease YdiL (CAAX protease family)